jgi:hypothetical protein
MRVTRVERVDGVKWGKEIAEIGFTLATGGVFSFEHFDFWSMND